MYFGKQTAPPSTRNERVLSNTNVLWICTIDDIRSDSRSFRQQLGTGSVLIKQRPHHRYNVISSLTSWNPNEAFEGDNQGLRTTLWRVYVGHSSVWIYYGCGFEIIKSLRIWPPCGSGSSHGHCSVPSKGLLSFVLLLKTMS